MLGTVKKYERNGAWGFILSDDPNVADWLRPFQLHCGRKTQTIFELR